MPLQDGDAGRRDVVADRAAGVVREADASAGDLALPGSTPQLVGQLDDLRQSAGADRVALPKQAPRGVDRKAAAEPGRAVGDQLAALPRAAQARGCCRR